MAEYQVQGGAIALALAQGQRFQPSMGQLRLDLVAGQPAEAQSCADRRQRRVNAGDGPTVLGAQPAYVFLVGHAGISYHDLELALEIVGHDRAPQVMQWVLGVSDGNELDLK